MFCNLKKSKLPVSVTIIQISGKRAKNKKRIQ